MSRPVPRIGRVIDITAILTFLAGAGVYAYAWIGMKRLQSFEPPPDGPPFAAMARFNELWLHSRTGMWLMAAGVALAVAAALVARLLRSRAART
jgi:hypothetical protein